MRALHGSGKIEFYADIILFLEREKNTGDMFLKIVKNRNRKYDYQDDRRGLTFDGAVFKSISPEASTAKETPLDDDIVAQSLEIFHR
jgi:hypothetical protein